MITHPTRWILLAALLALLAGCDDEKSPDRWSVTIHGEGDSPITSFRGILALPDGRVLSVSCPDSGPGTELTCRSQGLNIPHFQGAARLTVKAVGYHFQSVDLTASELAASGHTVTLFALPDFEQNDDYTTGFAGESGLQTFTDMAWPSSTELGEALLVKFYIDNLEDEPRVYFQNTLRHPIHYDFVRQVLGKPLSPTEFSLETYRGTDRRAMAGSILYYPNLTTSSAFLGAQTAAPFVLTFFPSDDLTVTQALGAHRLIEERLGCASLEGAGHRLAYVPAGETQEQQLTQQQLTFLQEDAAWLLRQELYGNMHQQLLNPGIAYGTLRLMTPEELATTAVSFADILILTRLPNDLPVVGGTITEELQTPLAHINVAARNRGTPNMALLNASTDERIAPFIGKLVRFEIKEGLFTLEETTQTEAEQYWASIHGDPVFPGADLLSLGLPRFSELSFDDSLSVGVKAANLAELRHILPDNTSDGFAVPFYYYQEFLGQATVDATLCQEAHAQCAASPRTQEACDGARDLCITQAATPLSLDTYVTSLLDLDSFKHNSTIREASLAGVRYFFTATPVDPDFAYLLDRRVAEIFGSGKVKLRSSTNAEDLPNFSGAGLYTSYGAHASGDDRASLVIRQTWASVWNWAAFEERAFWNIDHLSVKMGVAVNMAFSSEAANGVIISQNIADPTVEGMYVNVQLGEIAVTNPEGGELPEIYSIIRNPQGGWQPSYYRYSSLSMETPIMTTHE
ncbi:hypothetical protein KKF84_22255, partial [Myxococcota bacterium]|nr:hypothetical protein [Myxococcota bacterium]